MIDRYLEQVLELTLGLDQLGQRLVLRQARQDGIVAG